MTELGLNPLATIAAGLIERAVNTALGLDPIASSALSDLHGRQIGIECSQPLMSFEITVADDTLQVLARRAERPHVRVQGSAANLLAAAARDATSGIQIDGDEGLVLSLQSIFSTLEPDLAGPLSNLIGERSADTLVGAGETALSLFSGFVRQLSNNASSSVASNLTRDFAGSADAEKLISGIEAVRERIDRLDARIQSRVQRRTDASSTDQTDAQ